MKTTMESKIRYACFQGNPAFSNAINRFSTKKCHSLCPPTMPQFFFALSPHGNKKTSPPATAISKSITATASRSACSSNRALPSSIGATFIPDIATTAEFLGYQWRLVTSLSSDTRISSNATNYLWQC